MEGFIVERNARSCRCGDFISISINCRLDDLEKAKEYYAKFVEVSDGAEDKTILTDSYMQTGLAFNNAVL